MWGRKRELRTGSRVAWVLGGLEVLLATAATLWLLSSPAVFRVYYPVLNVSAHREDALNIAKWLSSTHRERSLSLALVDGQLGPKELKHYSDVRRVFWWFPRALASLAVLTALLLATFRPSLRVLAEAQWRGLILWLLLLVTLGGLALWDWRMFFAGLHQPFFGDRSWRLPKGAYSLTLFPASFWRTLTVAVLVAPALLIALVRVGIHGWQRNLGSVPAPDSKADAQNK